MLSLFYFRPCIILSSLMSIRTHTHDRRRARTSSKKKTAAANMCSCHTHTHATVYACVSDSSTACVRMSPYDDRCATIAVCILYGKWKRCREEETLVRWSHARSHICWSRVVRWCVLVCCVNTNENQRRHRRYIVCILCAEHSGIIIRNCKPMLVLAVKMQVQLCNCVNVIISYGRCGIRM